MPESSEADTIRELDLTDLVAFVALRLQESSEPDRGNRHFLEVLRRLTALERRAEQAEGLLRRWMLGERGGSITVETHDFLPATTPGEPQKCPPGCEGDCDGV